MTYKISAVWEQYHGDEQVGELEVEIEFKWHKGFKGDQIDPPEPAFAELVEVTYDWRDLPKATTYSYVWDWAEDWLENNQQRAAEVVREARSCD